MLNTDEAAKLRTKMVRLQLYNTMNIETIIPSSTTPTAAHKSLPPLLPLHYTTLTWPSSSLGSMIVSSSQPLAAQPSRS
jgi:hypothetical protein